MPGLALLSFRGHSDGDSQQFHRGTLPPPYLTPSALLTTPEAGAADPCSARGKIQNTTMLLLCQATTELFNLFCKVCPVPGVEGNSQGSAWNLLFSPFPEFFAPFAVAAPGEGGTIPLSSISWPGPTLPPSQACCCSWVIIPVNYFLQSRSQMQSCQLRVLLGFCPRICSRWPWRILLEALGAAGRRTNSSAAKAPCHQHSQLWPCSKIFPFPVVFWMFGHRDVLGRAEDAGAEAVAGYQTPSGVGCSAQAGPSHQPTPAGSGFCTWVRSGSCRVVLSSEGSSSTGVCAVSA